MNIVRALSVSVYRDADGYDCSNNGITSRYDRVYLVGEGIDGPYKIDLDDPPENVLKLEKKVLFGNEEYLRAIPLQDDGSRIRMMGGNFIHSCDSRFPAKYPIPVHDRYETQKEYEMYSR